MNPIQQALQTAQINPTTQMQQSIQTTLQRIRQNMSNNQTDSSLSAVTKAIATLSPQSTDTTTQVGKAIQSPNYAGYCLKWVDDQTGKSNRQPTAYADYQTNVQAGNINTSTSDIPKGARVYFAPDSSNGGMGHVGLSNGDGTFTSATDNGIQTFGLSDWEKYAGQKYLGYANPTQSS